jgi:ribonuclease G
MTDALRLLAASSPGEVRVALVRGASLLAYAIERPGAPDGVGDVHRGRIAARRPALGGSFVALDRSGAGGGAFGGDAPGGGAQAGGVQGFLPDSEGALGLAEGALLGVRVVRAAQGGKGPRLTARLEPGQAAASAEGKVRLVARGPGALERMARAHPGAAIETDDAALAATLAKIGRELRAEGVAVVARAFPDVLEAEIEGLGEPGVALPGGLRASIHPTPALVAIDVDSGPASNARTPKPVAQREANRAALPALVRQMVLRNLSGAILVDLAGMAAKKRAALGPELAAALRADPLGARLLGFTALGLAEIVRARVHPPLHEVLAGPHAAGLLALRQVARAVAAEPGPVRALRAAPDVVAALQADPVALGDLARRSGRALILRSDPAMGPGGWAMEAL